MILGNGCKFVIAPGVVVVQDPYGSEIGSVVFSNAMTCERYWSAVGNCMMAMRDDELESSLSSCDPEGF